MTDLISVILPSRGRWTSLERAIASLTRGAGVEIVVGLDEDDPAPAGFSLESFPGCRVEVNPRQASQGALFNLLAEKAEGEWLLPFPDDYTVDQADWADTVRAIFPAMPQKLGVAYLKDPMYPHFATFPVVSRRMVQMTGYFMPDFFPFLFGDTWWNEIGVMAGLIFPTEASVTIGVAHGHEHNIIDLAFWTKLFERTRPVREDIAIRCLSEVFNGDESPGWAQCVNTLADRSAALAEMQRRSSTA